MDDNKLPVYLELLLDQYERAIRDEGYWARTGPTHMESEAERGKNRIRADIRKAIQAFVGVADVKVKPPTSGSW